MGLATDETRSGWVEALVPEGGDSAARRHLVFSLAFLLVCVGFGSLSLLELAAPGLLAGSAFWSFGRLRAMYQAAAVYGWLTLAGMAVIYFLLPRLTGVRLHFERLANANLWLAVLVYGGGTAAIGLGHREGRPFVEFPVWLDPLVLLTLTVPALVVTATVRHRRERNLYVSLWYLLAASYWVPLVYLAGNLPGLAGSGAAIQGWFHFHNLVGLWLGALGVAALYYLVPRLTGRPLYSYGLALIGFWSLAFAHVWAGATGLIHGPVPEWLQTMAAVFAVALVVPALAVLANLAGTAQGAWERVRDSYALRFAVLGGASYLTLAVVTALQSSRSASALLGFTPWWEGTWTLTLFGFLTPWMAAFVYYAWPRILGRDWYDRGMSERHLRLTAVGVVVATLSLWGAGLVSGYTWAAGALSGSFANHGEGFAATLEGMGAFYLLAALGMLLVAAGQAVFVFSAYRSYTSGPAVPQEVLVPAEAEPEEPPESEPAEPEVAARG